MIAPGKFGLPNKPNPELLMPSVAPPGPDSPYQTSYSPPTTPASRLAVSIVKHGRSAGEQGGYRRERADSAKVEDRAVRTFAETRTSEVDVFVSVTVSVFDVDHLKVGASRRSATRCAQTGGVRDARH